MNIISKSKMTRLWIPDPKQSKLATGQACAGMTRNNSNTGQILTELLIAIGLVALIIAVGSQFINIGTFSASTSSDRETANRLADEYFEALRAIVFSNTSSTQGWNNIYLPPNGAGSSTASSKGASNNYKLQLSNNIWLMASGTETVSLGSKNFFRYFTIDNTSRSTTTGAIDTVYNSNEDDPQTQKITIYIAKSGGSPSAASATSTYYEYFTRYLDESANQVDWSGAQNCGPSSATNTIQGACATSSIVIATSGCIGGATCIQLSH